jgi:hypothetical protein
MTEPTAKQKPAVSAATTAIVVANRSPFPGGYFSHPIIGRDIPAGTTGRPPGPHAAGRMLVPAAVTCAPGDPG